MWKKDSSAYMPAQPKESFPRKQFDTLQEVSFINCSIKKYKGLEANSTQEISKCTTYLTSLIICEGLSKLPVD